jgi:ATP-dependent Clp protease ATP-binding subunit ClpA
MYERFTDRARKVMQLAYQEAARFNHEYIGTEHILLGLVREGNGVATQAIKNLGVDLRKIRLEVEKLVQRGPDMVTMGKLPQTPRAKKVIEYSMDEARGLNHNYVGTEHILLGLLREQEEVAAQVLTNLGLTLDHVRAEVLKLLDHGTDWDRIRKGVLDHLSHGSAPATLTNEEIAKIETYFADSARKSKSESQDLPASMHNRSTDRARRVMQLANQQAKLFNHEYIGTEHILLGLVSEGSGVAANVLKNLNIDLETIRSEVGKFVQRGPDRVAAGKLPWTPRAKKVVEYAMEEARNLNHNYVGTEHILLGLLREEEGVAAQVLMNLGLKLGEVRKEVLDLLGTGTDDNGQEVSQPARGDLHERFTDRARRVMQLANQEAQRFNHEYVGTEHQLLGLIKEGSGVAANVLKNLGVDLRKIRVEVEKLVQRGPDMVTMGRLPRTPRAKKVIEYSIEEARKLNHDYVGTEHVLLGLLRELEGVAAQILMNLGLKQEEVREEVLELLGHGLKPVDRGARPIADIGGSTTESNTAAFTIGQWVRRTFPRLVIFAAAIALGVWFWLRLR